MTTDQPLKIFIGSNLPDLNIFQEFDYVSHDQGRAFNLVKFHDLDIIPELISDEYYWLFSLRRTLYGMGVLPKTITISHTGKFVINNDLGRVLPNENYLKYVTSEDVRSADFSLMMSSRTGSPWLIGQPFFFGGGITVLEQYNACHPVRDLLRFSSEAIDAGLPQDYVLNFLKSEFMFPSPSVGTFEVLPFLKILDVLENIAFRFIENGYLKREGYQSKSVCFLLERLHSFLLTVHLESVDLLNNPDIFGYQVIYSEDGNFKS